MAATTIAERFEQMIKELHISKAEFARQTGVTRNYIYTICGGKNKSCGWSFAMLIEQKFGYPAEWIVTGEASGHSLKNMVTKQLQTLDDETLQSVADYLAAIKEKPSGKSEEDAADEQ
jgi:transcriptional regulator with XRE-family HTH domain